MRYTQFFTAAMILLLWTTLGPGQIGDSKLLPTAQSAKTIRVIQTELHRVLPNTNLKLEQVRHERQFSLLRDDVSKFIAAQLEAYPKIPPSQLREQLIRLLDIQHDGQSSIYSPQSPYVFRVSDDPGLQGWAVVYGECAHPGLGGSRIVVESYVLDQGKARLAGRAGSEMDGVALNAEQILFSRDSLSVLVHGILTWSSGHELPARATMYNINVQGVRLLWRFDTPGFQFIGAGDGLFVIGYHDEDRHGKGLMSTAVDMYVLPDPIGRPKRVSHIYPDDLRGSAAR